MKNNQTGLTIWMTIILVMVTVMADCGSSNSSFINKEINPNIDVFGIKLNVPESEVHKLAGSKSEKSMCINGYEYDYTDKLINMGFDIDRGKVRRVTTKNPSTSIFGITPGMDLTGAYAHVKDSGFIKDSSSEFKFNKKNIILTIISMKGVKADGITIEINPD